MLIYFRVTYDRSVFTPGLTDHINCNQYWWRNILYINNWYPFSQMCMIWSWYLANDMQLYVIAIVLLILSTRFDILHHIMGSLINSFISHFRFFKFSVITLCLVLLGSWTFAIFVSVHFNYIHKVSDPFESFDILYDKPWQRIGPYIMGMYSQFQKLSHNIYTKLQECWLATFYIESKSRLECLSLLICCCGFCRCSFCS